MHKTLKLLRERLQGFRHVWIALALFLSFNIAVFSLISLWPGLLNYLWLSPSNPWGIFTANFTHATLSHIESNLEGFVIIVFGFAVVCSTFTVKARRRWGRIFLWLTFLSGIVWCAIQYFLFSSLNLGYGYGASIMVNGALGVFFVAYIRSLFPLRVWVNNMKRGWNSFTRSTLKKRMRKTDSKNFIIAFIQIVPLIIFVFFLVPLLTNPTGFFGAGINVQGQGHVGWQAHLFGFLFGFLVSPLARIFLGLVARRGFMPTHRTLTGRGGLKAELESVDHGED